MKRWFVVMALVVAALAVADLLTGSVAIPPREVVAILTGGEPGRASWGYIVMETRLPQTIVALLSGASLAVSGLMLQTAFRNPLADPAIFGISAGAGLGAAIVLIAMGGSVVAGTLSLSGFSAVMAGAFLGAMAVAMVVVLFSAMVGNGVLLLIIGIMIGYLASSAVSLLNFFATAEGVKSYIVWGMGSFGGVPLRMIPAFAVVCLGGLAAALLMVKPLNVLLLGNSYASNLGISPSMARNILLVVTGVLTAVVTACCGPISFIGLAVPHIARLLFRRSDHKVMMPATMLTGSAVALLCLLLTRIPSTALPLSAVTPLIGAPVVIYIILRHRHVC